MYFPADIDTSWVLIEGAISHFCCAQGEESLLQALQRRRAEGRCIESEQAALALDRFARQHSAQAGEYEDAFACVLGEHAVCGTFCGADMLGNGNKVRIVAKPMAQGQFYAIAVERAKDGLLWLPTYTWRGAHADATFDSELDGQLSIWMTLVCLTILLVIFGFTTDNPWPHRAVWVLCWIFVMKAGTSLFDFSKQSPAPEHHQGSRIFRMLSYPDPDKLDMSCVRLDPIDQENPWRTVYRYQAALAINAGPADELPGKKEKH